MLRVCGRPLSAAVVIELPSEGGGRLFCSLIGFLLSKRTDHTLVQFELQGTSLRTRAMNSVIGARSGSRVAGSREVHGVLGRLDAVLTENERVEGRVRQVYSTQ